MRAKLRFSYGTMSSGKSLQVLTTAYNFEQRNIPFIILKSIIDTRDNSIIKSRIGDGITRECVVIDSNENLYDKIKTLLKQTKKNLKLRPEWIIIDECQFLSEEQIDQLSDIVDFENINVWCFGLRTDFKTRLFPGSKRLFEIADKIEEIKSSCECGRKNTVNARMTKDGKLAVGGAQVEVGYNYSAICRKCYKNLLNKHNDKS